MVLTIRAYYGETEEPNFATQYMVADGMLARLRKHLADGLSSLHPDVAGRISRDGSIMVDDSAPSAPSAGSSASSSRGRRWPGTNPRAAAAAPIATLEAVATVNFRGVAAGRLAQLNIGDGYSAMPAKRRTVLNHLIRALEAQIREATFRMADVVDRNAVPLLGYASSSAAAGDGDEILGGLTASPFDALDGLRTLNTGVNSNVPIGTRDRLRALMAPAPLPPGVKLLDTAPTGPDITVAGATVAEFPLIWIPERLPPVFYDEERWDTLYVVRNERCEAARKSEAYRTVDAGSANELARISGQSYPYYAVLADGKFWSAALVTPVGKWPTEGVGGQGAMRCDAAAEYDCFGSDGAIGVLGRAIGCPPRPQDRRNYAFTQGIVYDWPLEVPPAEDQMEPLGHEVRTATFAYAKKYLASDKKKNLPRETRPLRLWSPADQREFIEPGAGNRAELKARMKISKLQMKQKGDCPGGLKLGKPGADRLSANMVMREALRSRFGSIDGRNLADWQGSASDFARMAFAADAVARSFWSGESEGLCTADGAEPSDEQLAMLRTDQEWCHLFGHGDGGAEVPDNFVCGSKHCNTEQLALELAQRFYRDFALKAKITAYLLPSALAPHAANRALLIQSFPGLDAAMAAALQQQPTTVDESQGRAAALRTALEEYFVGYSGRAGSQDLDCRTTDGVTIRLRGNTGAISDGPVPTKAAFADDVLSALFPVVPIAYMIRYKVYAAVGDVTTKCIDHVFSGQREEMDFREFQALQWGFRLRIARALDATVESGKQHAEICDLLKAKVQAS